MDSPQAPSPLASGWLGPWKMLAGDETLEGERLGCFFPALLTWVPWLCPLVAPSLSEARFPPSTLPASGGNSHPVGYSQRLQHYLGSPVPCPRNLYVAAPSSSFAMETRENSFSYLILGDTLLNYCLSGVFLNKLTF